MNFHPLPDLPDAAHASREDLEAEMLGLRIHAAPNPHPHLVALHVSDRESPNDDASTQQLLKRRLGVARELLMRELRDHMAQGPVMSSPQVLRDWLRLRCAGLQHEVFLALYLDANHRLIAHEEVFRGTLTQTSVYPRELVKSALARNAAAIAVAHNHPSGQAEPSRADEFLTQTLKTALAMVDVRLIDHLVVAGDQCVSFAERGLL
ncbi:MAG: DNA repair protein RadC [Ideonella sp. WA131b]|jgi:DNA repair protein RadC|nr:DNA repair protein RadC [Ideonella sp. WA131b]